MIDRETVIRLAREAVNNGDGSELSGDAIERFAQLVFLAAAEVPSEKQIVRLALKHRLLGTNEADRENLIAFARELTCGVPASDNTALIAAAEKYADAYEGESIPAQDVRASIQNAFFAGYAWAGKAGLALPAPARQFTDAEIEAWAERHDIAGNEGQLRVIFDDARSLVPSGVKGPEHG